MAMVLLSALIRIIMPESRPNNGLNYLDLLTSLPGLLRKLPVLKEAALSGALLFAAFSVFWTTLIFHLEALPFHLGTQTAGCFGLVGAAGAIAASMSGRLADRLGARRIVASGTGVVLLAWILMGLGGSSLLVLACGAALLDLGVQGAHVANQTRIFAHMPEARSRINTIYIVSFFAGGAFGSLASTSVWTLAGWPGVCLLGGTLMGLALLAGFALHNEST
jgi:predicted MFS family arabinose efflux permease